MFNEAPLQYATGQSYRQVVLADEEHFIDYMEGTSRKGTLFITFYPFAAALKNVRSELPWGGAVLHGMGVSVLGIKPVRTDHWYRNAHLHDFFESADFRNFAAGFDRVAFYGGSMGGYAAIGLSSTVPGADVLALSPQSTMVKALVPFEWRWQTSLRYDWTGRFVDAAVEAASARKIYITYDPIFRLDRLQMARFTTPNVTKLHVPLVGHSTAAWLTRMGVLKPLLAEFVAGDIDVPAFYRTVRKRRDLGYYYLEMARQARWPSVRAHCSAIARRMGESDVSVLVEISNLHFRDGNYELAAELLFDVIRLKPNLPHGPYRMSRLLVGQKRYDEALAYAEKAAAIAPNNAVYQTWISKIHQWKAENAEAAPDIESASAV